jgi:DNA-binding transcriptional LysR family regulator
MELRRIRYFVAVAEELSFTRAAERLHIAQPPLSTQIRLLEEELGARLFFLTQAGRHLLDRAREILGAVDEATDEVRNAAVGAIGRIQFGYTASAMFTSHLPSAIRAFASKYPQVQLTVEEMPSLDQINALHNRTIDGGILRRPGVPIPPGLALKEWYQAPLVLAAPEDHPIARKRAVHLRELKGEPLITYPKSSGIGLYWHILELCAKAGFHPRVVQEVLEPTTIIGLVAAGIGLAIVPADTQYIQLAGVRYLRLLDGNAVSTLYLGYRQKDSSVHLSDFLAILRNQGRTGGPTIFAKQTNVMR